MQTTAVVQKIKAIKWWFVFKGVLTMMLLIPILIVIGLSPVVGRPLYDKLLFRPTKYSQEGTAKAFDIVPIDVYFNSETGTKLHGLLYKLPNAKKIFLINHGNAGNIYGRAHIADLLLRTGNSVFAYDYAGYGRSQGQPSLEGICQDGRGAYKYLLEQNYKPNQIILFGESIGTLVTGEMARSLASAAVILECPLYSLRRRGCSVLPYLKFYPAWAWTVGGISFDNSTAFKKEHSPLLLVAGTADHNTPIEQADELFAVASAPKSYIRIDGAGHGDPVMMSSPKYKQELNQFLKSLN